MRIRRSRGLEGARGATGATVVVDAFRAFTTAAYLAAAEVERLIVVAEVAEAERLATRLGAIRCGEVGGVKPAGWELGNSPGEVVAAGADLRGRVVVLRSSSGTPTLAVALQAGAGPVLAAAFVTATATARMLGDAGAVSLVAAGFRGREPAAEDDAVCDLLTRRLGSDEPFDTSPFVARARTGTGAQRLATAPWVHPEDLDRCLEVDRFGFALLAVSGPDGIRLEPRRPGAG